MSWFNILSGKPRPEFEIPTEEVILASYAATITAAAGHFRTLELSLSYRALTAQCHAIEAKMNRLMRMCNKIFRSCNSAARADILVVKCECEHCKYSPAINCAEAASVDIHRRVAQLCDSFIAAEAALCAELQRRAIVVLLEVRATKTRELLHQIDETFERALENARRRIFVPRLPDGVAATREIMRDTSLAISPLARRAVALIVEPCMEPPVEDSPPATPPAAPLPEAEFEYEE